MEKDIKVIFDNGGGITLQLGYWAHSYDGDYDYSKQAATDFAEFIKTRSTEGWEGHDEESLKFCQECQYTGVKNPGYDLYYENEILERAKNLTEEDLDVIGRAEADFYRHLKNML